MSLLEAASTGGARRFRPILLTSLTTFAGLMPLIQLKSTNAQFLIPMAVSLGYGILFATLITLFLVPRPVPHPGGYQGAGARQGLPTKKRKE